MQTTRKHTKCGLWEDAGFSDFRREYARAGGGGVTFLPFWECATNHIESEKKLFILYLSGGVF